MSTKFAAPLSLPIGNPNQVVLPPMPITQQSVLSTSSGIVLSQPTVPQISLPGFQSIQDLDKSAYITSIYGREFTGKTRFCLTAPPPIAFICNDPKTEDAVRYLTSGPTPLRDPRQIFLRVFKRVEVTNGTDWTPVTDEKNQELQRQIALYRDFVKQYKQAAIDCATHPDIRSIVIDSATVLYEDLLCAQFGRASTIPALSKTSAATEMQMFVKVLAAHRCRDGSPKHIILTNYSGTEYKDNKATANTYPGGCAKLGYVVSNLVELCIIRDGSDIGILASAKGPEYLKTPIGSYYCNLVRSIRAPHLTFGQGKAILMNSDITYPNLMRMIYTESPQHFV